MTMRKRTAVCFIAFALFAVPAALACPEKPLADLSRAEEFANDATLPLRFPLNGMNQLRTNNIAMFCTAGGYGLGPSGEFHAAEDYHLPAGTSVYAMADGEISYSGPREGYGWLIHHRSPTSEPVLPVRPSQPEPLAHPFRERRKGRSDSVSRRF